MKNRRINVEVDGDLLVVAQHLLGTATIKETIEEALREVLRVDARRTEVAALANMRGMDLQDAGRRMQSQPHTQGWRPGLQQSGPSGLKKREAVQWARPLLDGVIG